MIYIRKIKESSWFMGQAPLDSDSISDLGTSNHELSVWQVPNDKSNLDDIVLALALTRDDTNGIFVVFIKTSFPQLFYPLMTRQFFCDFHEKSEDFCVS